MAFPPIQERFQGEGVPITLRRPTPVGLALYSLDDFYFDGCDLRDFQVVCYWVDRGLTICFSANFIRAARRLEV